MGIVLCTDTVSLHGRYAVFKPALSRLRGGPFYRLEVLRWWQPFRRHRGNNLKNTFISHALSGNGSGIQPVVALHPVQYCRFLYIVAVLPIEAHVGLVVQKQSTHIWTNLFVIIGQEYGIALFLSIHHMTNIIHKMFDKLIFVCEPILEF